MAFCELEQPSLSTATPSGVAAQMSKSSVTPSPSGSFWESEQPILSAVSPSGVSVQASSVSATPSLSSSKIRDGLLFILSSEIELSYSPQLINKKSEKNL